MGLDSMTPAAWDDEFLKFVTSASPQEIYVDEHGREELASRFRALVIQKMSRDYPGLTWLVPIFVK